MNFNFGNTSTSSFGGTSGTTFSFGQSSSSSTTSFASTSSFGGSTASTGTNFGFSSGGLAGNGFSGGIGGFGQQAKPDKAPIMTQLEHLAQQFHRDSPYYPFKTVFYNRIQEGVTPANYKRPPELDEQLWAQAMQRNPDPKKYVPVIAKGFGDLRKRMEKQSETVRQHDKLLQQVDGYIVKVKESHELEVKAKMRRANRHAHVQRARFLRIMIQLTKRGAHGLGLSAQEEEFFSSLDSMLVHMNQPTQYKARLNELSALVRIRQNAAQGQSTLRLEDEETEKVEEILDTQVQGLSALTAQLEADLIACRILKEQFSAIVTRRGSSSSSGTSYVDSWISR